MKTSHFNWDYAVENTNVEDFLSGGESLWGYNQGFENEGRQHWLRYLKAFPKPADSKLKVCELGFGAGVDLQLLKESGQLQYIEMYGVDVTTKFCQHAALKFPEIKVTQINGYDIPFPDKFFDVLYMRHVLEHQENYRWQLREAFRVTSKELFINFFIPLTSEPVDEIVFDNIFYHNKYSRKLLETFCDKYGWEITNTHTYVKRKDEADYVDQVVVLRRKS